MSNKTSDLRPYDFMVRYTPQEAWIKGKGAFLWLAFFLSEIGAGIYLVSLFLGLRTGWLIGWLVTLVLGGGLHLLFLGKPFRVLFMFLSPKQSELSRGLWVILFFAILGFFQVSPIVLPSLPWTGTGSGLKAVMGIICILLVSHGFLTMGGIRAIPLWNSSMMALLSVISGIWVGSQFAVIFSYGETGPLAEIWARWSLFCFMAFLGAFILGAGQASTTTRISVKSLLTGETSSSFYIGVLGIGMVIPVIITLVIWGSESGSMSLGILLLRCLCVFAGDLMMRYSIMKNAHYSPLI